MKYENSLEEINSRTFFSSLPYRCETTKFIYSNVEDGEHRTQNNEQLNSVWPNDSF